MHRILQWRILNRLDQDPDSRQKAFDKAFQAIRDVFPKYPEGSRSIDLWPEAEKYLPQVMSLNAAYRRSDPPIKAGIEYATLLCDASMFLWEQSLPHDGVPLLMTAEQVCTLALPHDSCSPVLAQVLTTLASFLDYVGIEGRKQAVEYQQRVINLRQRYLDQTPENDIKIDDRIALGRAWNDMSDFCFGLDRVDEAVPLVDRAMALYESIGTEETMTYRFGHQYSSLAVKHMFLREPEQGLVWIERSYNTVVKVLGTEHVWAYRFQFMWAWMLLCAGKLDEALTKHLEVLEAHRRLQQKTNPETLSSYYFVGTTYYYQGNLERAE